jgi:hypothetical protein
MYSTGIIQHLETLEHDPSIGTPYYYDQRCREKLTGAKRRAFQAQVSIDYLNSNPRLAEKTFGWDRKTVALGLNEFRTGIVCVGNFKARGNKKMEVKKPQLEADIVSLAEPKSQTDPKFQTAFKFTRITAKGMREALIADKGWKDEDLPCAKTIGNILNRLGYPPGTKGQTAEKD